MGPDQPICDKLNEMFEVNKLNNLELIAELKLLNGFSKDFLS
jgi:hypothetical protein